jgi:hypothetical protein
MKTRASALGLWSWLRRSLRSISQGTKFVTARAYCASVICWRWDSPPRIAQLPRRMDLERLAEFGRTHQSHFWTKVEKCGSWL